MEILNPKNHIIELPSTPRTQSWNQIAIELSFDSPTQKVRTSEFCTDKFQAESRGFKGRGSFYITP